MPRSRRRPTKHEPIHLHIIAGLFGTFALSCAVLVLAQQAQLGGLQPIYTEDEPGKFTDITRSENVSVEQGRAVYMREGCVTCHSQQMRDEQNGTDIARGWGPRRTVARDYLFEHPPFLGSSRLGPDLANAGSRDWRNETEGDTRRPAKRDAAWHFAHLYAPRDDRHGVEPSAVPLSLRGAENQRPALARRAEARRTTSFPIGKQIVPGSDARALVQYLLSLDRCIR